MSELSNPNYRSWERLERLVCYVKDEAFKDEGHWIGKYVGKDPEEIKLKASTDSNWTQAKQTMKSSMMIILRVGSTTLYSKTINQAIQAKSSSEAEYYAMVSAANAGLEIKKVLEWQDFEVEFEIESDSTVAISVAQRRGEAKIRTWKER